MNITPNSESVVRFEKIVWIWLHHCLIASLLFALSGRFFFICTWRIFIQFTFLCSCSCFRWSILLIFGLTSDINVISHHWYWFFFHYCLISLLYLLLCYINSFVVNLREQNIDFVTKEPTPQNDEHNEVLATHISLSLYLFGEGKEQSCEYWSQLTTH